MAKLTLNELQAAMNRMGIAWEANETEISSLMNSAGAHLFGLIFRESSRIAVMNEAKATEPTFMATPPPPPVTDWRNINNNNFVTDIRNQGTCGSCVAFATCAVLESRARINANNPQLIIDLSEAHLFSCGKGADCTSGWNFTPALEFCRDNGVGLEAGFPYKSQIQSCKNIPAHVQVPTWDVEVTAMARKQAIAVNGPVIGGMRVFEDLAYYRGGIYRHVAGSFQGLHAVAIVGYDDNQDCWMVKNSWGTGWGENGFMRIGYGECGIDSNFPYYDPEVVLAPIV